MIEMPGKYKHVPSNEKEKNLNGKIEESVLIFVKSC